MTSAPSSASLPRAPLSVFFWSLKKCAPVAAVTAVLMILIQPALLLLLGLSWLRTKTIFTGADAAGNFEPVYLTTQVCTLLVSCVLVVVVTSMLFGYLQSKRSLDLFHSLPITRTGLFAGKYAAGLVLISVPLILLCALNVLVMNAFGFSLGTTASGASVTGAALVLDVLRDLGVMLLLQTAAYTLTCFVFVNTGTTFDSIISLLAVNAVYPVLMLFVTLFFSQRLIGFEQMLDEEVYMLLSPFARLVASPLEHSLFSLVWWAVFTPALLAAAVWQYNRRKSEQTGNAYTFPVLKILFKICIPFAAGLALSSMFTAVFYSETVLIASFLMGAAVAYVIVEAVVSRGFRNIVKGGVPLLVSTALFFGMFFGAGTGWFGYETRLPARGDLKTVTVTELSGASADYSGLYEFDDGVTLSEAESLDAFYSLHQSIVSVVREMWRVRRFGMSTVLAKPENISDSALWEDGNWLTVKYILNLKNGAAVRRSYRVSETDFPKLFDGIAALRELRYKSSPVMNPKASDTGWTQLQISRVWGFVDESNTTELSAAQSRAFAQAYKKDLLDETPEQAASGALPAGYLYAYNETGSFFTSADIAVRPHYENLLAFLEQNGFMGRFEGGVPEGVTACVVKDIGRFMEANNLYINGAAGVGYDYSMFAGGPPSYDPEAEPYGTALTSDRGVIEALAAAAITSERPEEGGLLFILARTTSGYTENTRVYYIPKDKIPPGAAALEYRQISEAQLPHSPGDEQYKDKPAPALPASSQASGSPSSAPEQQAA